MAGPRAQRRLQEHGLLKEWPKDGPPLAWKVKDSAAATASRPSAAGRIFGMSNRGDDEVVWALSEKDGKSTVGDAAWAGLQAAHAAVEEGPGCTPTVDGDRLYVLGMGGDLACLRSTTARSFGSAA